MEHLLEFYGAECPHCAKMRELTLKLEQNENITLNRLEVWHNKENMAYLEKCDPDLCGGVPFFLNTKTNKWICGEATYEEMKAWAMGNN